MPTVAKQNHAARQRVVAAPAPGLCLDFANTRFWRGSEQPTESIPDFDALVRWLHQTGAVDAATAAILGALRDADAPAAQRLLADVVAARELLYGLFAALAAGSTIEHDAAALGALLATAPPRGEAVLCGDLAGWRVAMHVAGAGELLAPVLWSAADLTLAGSRVRLRQCANERCRWLFIDDSKAGTRRWCSMSACGNRAKAQRHYLRHAARSRPTDAT